MGIRSGKQGHPQCRKPFDGKAFRTDLGLYPLIPVYSRSGLYLAINPRSDLEHLHYLVPQMVDDLDRDAPGGGLVERSRGVAVERGPGVGVDFGFERGL